ncbi:hypothetical protein [Spirosoma foliorum]|uniref:Uncharacterized protein n=1 Tax=Spirosoma foliorum TaxID=2710596 RepID=A0A7G5GQ99_9BACT|nr:hypothetical protein [Spirosoma foliorum]QMW01041.1 hypothetical protein H3H32_24115 [Spirosoma foliorum]
MHNPTLPSQFRTWNAFYEWLLDQGFLKESTDVIQLDNCGLTPPIPLDFDRCYLERQVNLELRQALHEETFTIDELYKLNNALRVYPGNESYKELRQKIESLFQKKYLSSVPSPTEVIQPRQQATSHQFELLWIED